jgi:tRNA (mo5U34)-methyltransferase
MGVFYHLRHPLLALDLVTSKVKQTLVFQTLTLPGTQAVSSPPDLKLMDREPLCHDGWPRMAFIERSLAGDPTNWWAANHAAVLALLRSCGMAVHAQPGHEIYVCRPDPQCDRVSALLAAQELSQIFGTQPINAGLG